MMRQMSPEARDVVLHLPEWLSNEAERRPQRLNIIFFITGNPGLIGFYEDFLKSVAEASRNAIVTGASLGGFEISGKQPTNDVNTNLEDDLLFPPIFSRPDLFDLQDQIQLSWKRLLILIKRLRSDYHLHDMPIEVVLMGHSVGAYIALEMVRQHHEAIASNVPQSEIDFRIVSTILLTPTIEDIAQSSSGKIATPVLTNLPFFPALLQLGSSALTATLPATWFRSLVARVTGMKNAGALDTTVRFLRKAGAVKQALHMARCEMAEIGVSRWKDEIWGVDTTTGEVDLKGDLSDGVKKWRPPKHFFLFAKDDHWVAQSTRDAIEQSMNGRGVILIDEDGSMGLVHAWCLEQSNLVAGIVNRWLVEPC